MMIADLTGRRLRSQGIDSPTKDVNGAAARLLAVQAQDRPAARWALGLRTGQTAAEVEKAAASGSIIRTWLMRGTLHFAAPGDVHWLLDLVAPKLITRSGRRDDQLGLDNATYERSAAVISKALDQGPLPRSQVMSVLESRGISTAGQRGYHVLRRLALEGLICFGPMVGREPSFVLLDSVVPRAPRLERGEALAMLARRYFEGHGPAGLRDLVWWSGITMSEARSAIDEAGTDLVKETFHGSAFWSAPMGGEAENGPGTHLLPAFDEYIIGYRDREAMLDAGHTKHVLSSNGIFYPTVVVDGRVRGTWRAKRSKNEVTIEAMPFSPLSSSEIEGVEGAVERYGKFIALPARLNVRL